MEPLTGRPASNNTVVVGCSCLRESADPPSPPDQPPSWPRAVLLLPPAPPTNPACVTAKQPTLCVCVCVSHQHCHACCSNEGLFVGEHDLQLYLKGLHNQLESVALHPQPGHLVRALRLAGLAGWLCAEQRGPAGLR